MREPFAVAIFGGMVKNWDGLIEPGLDSLIGFDLLTEFNWDLTKLMYHHSDMFIRLDNQNMGSSE